ncbi:hypothetical protein E4U31_004988 [Claviceps sp. LM219 group G6]|nr:hypothetical protein E4U15_006091 [Claviceps sp. LM218 group G6]KAG6111086.1 hypothetical protein E4U31_004988 [Claviceps sp. LM219 group G6]
MDHSIIRITKVRTPKALLQSPDALDSSILMAQRELSDIQRGPDLAIAVACRDIDVRNVRAIIMGPHETPYEFGFFEFAIRFTKEYPSMSPKVQSVTTNGGRCRFNPNIYANGKVCFTWRGERGEEWSSAQGLESILLSIQSLMSANPYENEPGYETAFEAPDKIAQKDYVQKIRHESLRISVIERLEGYLGIDRASQNSVMDLIRHEKCAEDDASLMFEPFKDLCKNRFLWYYQSYLDSIEKGKSETRDSQPFARMPFESIGSNSMEGKFNYSDLERRLHNIKAALDAEPGTWAQEGLEAVANETTVATNLQHQYRQVTTRFKQCDLPHDVTLEGGNPFVWTITYFGGPMTKLDGGLFQIRMHFSTRFPEEQPRVRLLTKLFHHYVASDGTICYVPNPLKRDDIKSHIDAIISTLEETEPAYDPRRIVNPEASKLLWGKGKDDKKQYNRRLRRSVQQSVE